MKYSRYPSYKDSGVEWFGKIPNHWDAVGFKRYFESIVDYRGKTPEKVDNGIFLVTARNIKKGVINYKASSEYVKIEDYSDIMSRGVPRIGDVLFTTEAPLGEVANIDNTNIALAQRVIKFCSEKDLQDNYYLKYLMMSAHFQNSLMLFASGSTALGIKAERLVYLRKLLPPLQEQQTIANYLDIATAKIDTLIEKQTRLIELLKEKRQAVISTAVTRGLDPSVPMKDSGVEWLGEIPEGWEVTPLRYIGRLQNGISKGGDYFGSGFPFVNYGDIYNNGTLPLQVKGLAKSSKEDQYAYSVQKGDVFFTRTSETIDDIGMASTCLETIEDATFSGFTIRFRQLKQVLDENFSKFYFRTGHAQSFFEEQLNLVTRASLGQDILKQLPVLLPPMEEQRDIAIYLDDKTSKIDNLTTKATKAINLLKEKRTALISSAVTGKIDVREIA